MDNDPRFGSSGPASSSNQAHIEPDQEDKKITNNNKEEEVVEEDFDKFNLDKVEDLEKEKNKKEE